MTESSFRRHRIGAVVNSANPSSILVALKFNGQLVGILSEDEARALGEFLGKHFEHNEKSMKNEETHG